MTETTPQKSKRVRRTKAQIEADEAAEAKRREELAAARAAAIPAPITPRFRKVFHVVNDGFTVFGKVRYRGEEFVVEEGTPEFALSYDRYGNFIFARSEEDQIEAYGEVKYREGPWPGLPYDTTHVYETGQIGEDGNKIAASKTEIAALEKANKQRQRKQQN